MNSKKRSIDEYKNNPSSSKKSRVNSPNHSSQSKSNEEEKILFSTTENLKKIKKGDILIEVIGYVDQIFPSREVSGNKNVFKFIINNADGIRIQINVWDKEIVRIEPFIILNTIIHIDGCRAKETNQYTKSQFKEYELVIESNTNVTNLGHFELENQFDISELKLIKISEISEYYTDNKLPKFFKVQGYMKTVLVEKENYNFNYQGCGTVTDGTFQLNILVHTFKKHSYEKGDHIELYGSFMTQGSTFYFTISKIDNIRKLDNKKQSINWLLKGSAQIEI